VRLAQINDPASLFLNPWTRIEDIFGGITRVDDKIVAIAALQVHYFFDSSPARYAVNPHWSEVRIHPVPSQASGPLCR
jgi:hypothetical protein